MSTNSNVKNYNITIEDLKNDITNHDKTKREKIVAAAEWLEKDGYEKEKISTQITQDLDGYVTSTYIRQCLDAKYKNKNKARAPKIAVTAGTGQQVADTEKVDPKKAREEYENNKYYKNVPKGSSLKSALSISEANRELEQTQLGNKEKNDYITSLQETNQQLSTKIAKLESERTQHTTVSLQKSMFEKVYNFISDKKVKRVLLDFDDNMSVVNVRADL